MSSVISSQNLRRNAPDAEQDSTPDPSVIHGGSSASGAQPSITTSTDLNTDVTGETRAGPAQDLTRASREDHIDGDVAMRGYGADENSEGHPLECDDIICQESGFGCGRDAGSKAVE